MSMKLDDFWCGRSDQVSSIYVRYKENFDKENFKL